MINKTLCLILLAGSTALSQNVPGERGSPRALSPSSHGAAQGSTIQRKHETTRVSAGITFLVPQQHPSIQSAIDAASDGDTVLVSEGTYFENIRYRGKAIVIASLYLADGDTSHIGNTVIDGSHTTHPDSGSVVYIVDGEDTTSVLCGFTIQNGTGTLWGEGYSRPRVGGGIFCLGSGARIVRNIVTRNRVVAPTAAGGGLAAENLGSSFPYLILEDNRFTDNYVRGDSPDTWGFAGGADLWRVSVRVVRNLFERNTVEATRRAGGGGMFFGGVDPSRFVTPPVVNVAPFPDGLILGNTFRNNRVNSGTHGGVGGGVALDATAATTIADNLFEGNAATTVTGWALGGALAVKDERAEGHGRKLISNNRFLENEVFASNSGSEQGSGGAIELFFTSVTISGNQFANSVARAMRWASGGAINAEYSVFLIDRNAFVGNTGWAPSSSVTGSDGGALTIYRSPPHEGERVVCNNLFTGNSTGWGGGAISLWEDAAVAERGVVIANNTIVGNRARDPDANGGGILVFAAGVRVIMNNILWENGIGTTGAFGNEIALVEHGSAQCFNNDIMGGWASGVGNIDAPPGFKDGSYHLSDTSACIGAGIDSIEIDDLSGWFHAPPLDLDGSARPNPPGSLPDIGALESPLEIGINQAAFLPEPLSIDFRNVHPGLSGDTLAVTLFNRSKVDRDVLSVALKTSEYRLTPVPALPLRIPAYQSFRFSVLFTPVSPGRVVQDTLLIATADQVQPVLSIPLTGRGSAPAQPAGAGTLYGVSSPSGGPVLHTLSKTTGSGQLIGPFSPCPQSGLCAFTVRHRDSTLYGAFSSLAGTDLYRFSPSFGDVEFAGTIPVGNVTSMAFDSSDALYMVTSRGEFYRSRIGGPETARVGSIGYPLSGLAVDPATNVLWASLHDSVFTVEPRTGVATLRGADGQNVPRSSITFNGQGTMYGLYASVLVIVDKVTGKASEIGVTGIPGLVALAMRSDVVTGAGDGETELANSWHLSQNFPNPFNPTTVIDYEIGSGGSVGAGVVRLVVYDLLGRTVAQLVNERQPAGRYAVTFDATGLASGMYIYQLSAGSFAQSRRMMLMK